MVFGFLIVAGLALLTSLIFSRHGDDEAGPALPTGWWLLLPALGLQLIWRRWLSTTDFGASWIWVLPASYVPLLLFLALNRRSKGVWLIGAGAVLNFTVMALNGGGMPAPLVLPSPIPSHIADAGWIIPYSKDRVFDVATSRVLLEPLSDRFRVALPGGIQSLFSIGDLLIVSGGFLVIAGVFRVDLAPVTLKFRQ